MKTRKKIRRKHRINSYEQECDNLLQAMKEVSDGILVWEIRNRFLALKKEIRQLENSIK